MSLVHSIPGRLVKRVKTHQPGVLCQKTFESEGSLMLEVMVRSDYVHNKGEGKVGFSVDLSETCVNEAALCRTFLVCTSWYQPTEDTTDVT